ncbi:UNVERIFIED_CONTAM: protein ACCUMULATION AND REPLICATION OF CHLOROPLASTS 3 [Sesamum calycinum]|uniref:Protein ACCUMULATION AND REPLICATION OF CHLOROPLASTS 3 n=1 Tax=Sesamum calycinum TaxID=2727403 RepID=A0AAW2QZ99_9LAMI
MMRKLVPFHVVLPQQNVDPSCLTEKALPFPSEMSAGKDIVASAAYGSDHITALEVLSNVKSGNGFVVGIILKPFRFEGQRRQDEVKDLVGKLEKQANFCIVLDTDTLLENDLVTLDEALRTTNNAILMAMNAISILLSEKHIKLLNTKDNSTRELQLPECREIFEGYNEASIGFGASYNVKTSLLRAINDCPFLGVDIKDFDGAILCIIASSGVADCSDANNILNIVRAITKCKGEIIVSIVHEPNQEPNTILATIIVFGYTRQQLAPKNGIFSSLGQHFPFIFNLFNKQHRRTNNSEKAFLSESLDVSDAINPPVNGDLPKTNPLAGIIEDCSEEGGVELLESNSTSSYELNSEVNPVWNGLYRKPCFQREILARGNLGPEKLEDESLSSKTTHGAAWGVDDNKKKQHYARPTMSWAGLADADFNNNVSSSNKGNPTSNSKKHGVLSLRAASMLVVLNSDYYIKESERDSQKKWSRVVEMKYRGGIYRGRAQGGLPEGKGRLLLGDGSIYDGTWRYGKRSGMGTFYFNNGDVFQGSWRDDVMHGKGWIYFHTGDRWFANFWKGKANGEGRFYSKLGDVSFGHFKEGWRHGHFLRINVDGTRFGFLAKLCLDTYFFSSDFCHLNTNEMTSTYQVTNLVLVFYVHPKKVSVFSFLGWPIDVIFMLRRSQELWDEGVLVSEKQLDPDAEVG